MPHLYKEGGSYFVTFRLADAITDYSANRKAAENLASKRPIRDQAAAKLAAISEPPLRLGSCVLAKPEIAQLVQNALRHFDGQRYLLSAWCAMPNHAHVVFTPLDDHTPSEVMHSWKSFTAHEANKLLGASGSFWERESFDHLIRSLEHYREFVEYVENNPVAAGFCNSPEEWPYSSAAFLPPLRP